MLSLAAKKKTGDALWASPRLAAGYWEPVLLLQQVLWIGVLAVAAAAAFRAGERRLQVVGG